MRGPQPWRTNRARVLRDQQVATELIMWRALRNRRLGGFKFVRQLPIGLYFADFACRDAKVVVELDGHTHSTDAELHHDLARTAAMQAMDYVVMRVNNHDVRQNLPGVLQTLLALVQERAVRK